MLPDMDLTKLNPEDRRRLAYYLEHNLINAISPLAACLDGNAGEARLAESARHAKKRIVGVVDEVRALAGLRPDAERLLSLGAEQAADDKRQLTLSFHPESAPGPPFALPASETSSPHARV